MCMPDAGWDIVVVPVDEPLRAGCFHCARGKVADTVISLPLVGDLLCLYR